MLKPKWQVEDWWYRFEWQHWGSVHVHGIGKIKNGPKIEWKQIKDDDTTKKKLVEEYLNNLVTTINLGIDSPVPTQHPCQKRHNEIANNEQDYIDLINKLQRHT